MKVVGGEMTNYLILARFFLVCIVILSCVALFAIAYEFMLPILIGFGLSMVLYKPSVMIHRYCKIPFSLSVLSVILSMFTAIAGITFSIGLLFWADFIELIKRLPHLFTQFTTAIQSSIVKILPLIEQAESWLLSKNLLDQHTANSLVKSIENTAVSFVQGVGETIVIELSLLVSTLPSMVFSSFIVLISAYFFTKEKEEIKKRFNDALPSAVVSYNTQLSKAIHFYSWSYVQAQMLLTAITATIVLIGLMILRVEGAPALALISALLDLLPVVGTSLLFVPWIFYYWINGLEEMMIGLIIIQCVILVARQLLEPKIIGQKLGIHPFIAFLLIYLSFQWFGLKGVIFSPLIMLTISTLTKAGTFNLLWIYIKKGTIR
ncbi:sporulation integral membrane protein YtvI [Jeotgalibacillus marinus]|uniref:Sporulation integral membrane protein YtvI n=1 Tax=Jeotgalibacillus marinus TaxID=86667 RepID=A0ABV3PZX4_9BACL